MKNLKGFNFESSGALYLGFDQLYELAGLIAKFWIIQTDIREVVAGVVLGPELHCQVFTEIHMNFESVIKWNRKIEKC